MGFMGWRRKRKFVPSYWAAWSHSSKLAERLPAFSPASTGFFARCQNDFLGKLWAVTLRPQAWKGQSHNRSCHMSAIGP